MKRIISSAAIAFLLILTAGTAFAQDFTIVVIPDTQYETEYNPAMLTSQMNWIVNHRSSNNIVFVTHVGDVVNNGTRQEFIVADAAFDKLDIGRVHTVSDPES